MLPLYRILEDLGTFIVCISVFSLGTTHLSPLFADCTSEYCEPAWADPPQNCGQCTLVQEECVPIAPEPCGAEMYDVLNDGFCYLKNGVYTNVCVSGIPETNIGRVFFTECTIDGDCECVMLRDLGKEHEEDYRDCEDYYGCPCPE